MRVFTIIPFVFIVYSACKYIIAANKEWEEAEKGWLFALFGWVMYFIACLESWK